MAMLRNDVNRERTGNELPKKSRKISWSEKKITGMKRDGGRGSDGMREERGNE